MGAETGQGLGPVLAQGDAGTGLLQDTATDIQIDATVVHHQHPHPGQAGIGALLTRSMAGDIDRASQCDRSGLNSRDGLIDLGVLFSGGGLICRGRPTWHGGLISHGGPTRRGRLIDPGERTGHGGLFGLHDTQGQVDPEGAAATGLALQSHLTVHEFRQLADDGESQPRPPMAAGNGGIGLGEGLEEPRLDLGRNTLPRIAHGDADLDLRLAPLQEPRLQGHPALVGELEGVVDQVDQDLLDAQRIPLQERWQLLLGGPALQGKMLFRRQGPEHLLDLLQQGREAERPEVELHGPGLDF